MRTWGAVGLAILVAVIGFRLLGGDDRDAGAAPPVRVSGAATAERLFVHVAGEVRRPGLYRLRAGSRVGEAVQRAGGPSRRADLSGINLAARIEDGRQVLVPRRGAAAVAASDASSAVGGASAPKLSLAGATVEQLDAIDGIGPTLAQRILEYRQAHGGFGSVEELREVEGIGDARFEALRQAVDP